MHVPVPPQSTADDLPNAARASELQRPVAVVAIGPHSGALAEKLSGAGVIVDRSVGDGFVSGESLGSVWGRDAVPVVFLDADCAASPRAERIYQRHRKDPAIGLVIVLSDSHESVTRWLARGVDDVVAAGASIQDAIVRLQVVRSRILSRAATRPMTESPKRELPSAGMAAHVSEFPELSLDIRTRVMTGNGKRVLLTRRECAFADVMSRRPCVTVSRQELLEIIWGREYRKTMRTNLVDVYARFLRMRLEAIGAGAALVTVRYVGYRLDALVAVLCD